MSLALSLLWPYLAINLLLLLTLGALRLGWWLDGRAGPEQDATRWLKWALRALGVSVLWPVAVALFPRLRPWDAGLEVWSGPASGSGLEAAGGLTLSARLMPPGSVPLERALELPWALQTVQLGIAIGAFILLCCWTWGASARVRSLARLFRRLDRLPVIRRIGRVWVLASVQDAIPFSTWRPGRAYVVIPSEMLADRDRTQMALRHELQHHRQGDTRAIYLLELASILCFWNPGTRGWSRFVSELQEFACDAVLVGRRKVVVQAYGRCLVEMAELVSSARVPLVGTTSMATRASSPLLQRRIERMILKKNSAGRGRSGGILAAICLAMISSIVVASGVVASSDEKLIKANPVAGELKELSLKELTRLAEGVGSVAFPIEANVHILERLNRFTSTEKGRRFIQRGLERLSQHERTLPVALKQAGLPAQLLAVPLIESGFDNMPETSTGESHAPGPRGAGIWMFIPSTARDFGLKVDQTVDERLDVQKETDAAIRLFSALYKSLGDWRLALAGYNVGENQVRVAMEKHQTRDIWVMMDKGELNGYVPTVMAGAVLLAHPELVR